MVFLQPTYRPLRRTQERRRVTPRGFRRDSRDTTTCECVRPDARNRLRIQEVQDCDRHALGLQFGTVRSRAACSSDQGSTSTTGVRLRRQRVATRREERPPIGNGGDHRTILTLTAGLATTNLLANVVHAAQHEVDVSVQGTVATIQLCESPAEIRPRCDATVQPW